MKMKTRSVHRLRKRMAELPKLQVLKALGHERRIEKSHDADDADDTARIVEKKKEKLLALSSGPRSAGPLSLSLPSRSLLSVLPDAIKMTGLAKPRLMLMSKSSVLAATSGLQKGGSSSTGNTISAAEKSR